MGIEKFDEMANLVREAREQYLELQGGKKVAAVRARKALQAIKRIAQEARTEVQTIKAGMSEKKETGSANPS